MAAAVSAPEMVGRRRRRQPLILASTKCLLENVRNPSETGTTLVGTPPLRLAAGILPLPEARAGGLSVDDSASVGVSVSLLKRLSVTSGSLVLVKNMETNVGRIGQVVALDPPGAKLVEHVQNVKLSTSKTKRVMAVLPSHIFTSNEYLDVDKDVAYLSPLLAFNLGLHISCLKALVYEGRESLTSLSEATDEIEKDGNMLRNRVVHIELLPWSGLPRVASNLQLSFMKIPECSVLDSLKGAPSNVVAQDRREMINSALADYFRVDRYIARADLFYIHINWTCNSELCISCNSKASERAGDKVIYFKIVAVEPSSEPFLCVEQNLGNQKELRHAPNIASAVPPCSLLSASEDLMPLQGDVVKTLTSVLATMLCPSALSSKLRVAVLLHGLEGSGK